MHLQHAYIVDNKCIFRLSIIVPPFAVITIGFVETNVMVSESDRNAGLQVAVLSGMLDFEIGIELEVTTRDGSASCKFSCEEIIAVVRC